jgi:hypothetical protein
LENLGIVCGGWFWDLRFPFVLKVNKIKIMLFFTVTLLLLLLFSVCGLEVKIRFGTMQPVFYILNSLIFYRKDFAFKMNEVMLLYNILGD